MKRRIASLLTRLPVFPQWPEHVDLEGIRVPIRSSPYPPRLRRHLMRGGYETDERRLVRKFIVPGDQVIEVGASSGVITSFLWRQVGSSGRVVSVEGNRLLKPFFDRVLELNGFSGEWVEAIAFPAWLPEAPVEFHSTGFSASDNPLGSKVSEPGSGSNGPESSIGPRVMTLQQVAEKTGLQPTALVADIEGTEAIWCDTPPRLPASLKTVILEVHPQLIGVERAGATLQALVNEGFGIAAVSGLVYALTRQ